MIYVTAVDESKDAADLERLRKRIDEVDTRLVELLAERMDIVSRVAAYKRRSGAQIRDVDREQALLNARRDQAESLGLSPDPVESIYRLILLASRDHQASTGAAAPRPITPAKVAIIGGNGAMGSVLQRLFGDLGHSITVADHETALSVEDAAAAADVVVLSVPIAETGAVIRQVGPHVRPDAILMDVTSIKAQPLSAMLDATEAQVVGTHPMFGPGVHSLIGQRVVLCEGRGDRAMAWAREMFSARGLVITEAAADEHDRAMALVQVLTHFQTQVLGLSLARCGVSLDESLRFTSPAYLMELYVAARHFAQAPDLYGPIEMLNPGTERVTAAFRDAASEISDILASGDQVRFDALFEEVRRYFGEFTEEAVYQSSFLVDRLVERSLG